MLTRIEKVAAPLVAEIAQARSVNEAHGRVIDRLSTELAEIKREAALAKRLEDARAQRRIEALETALLATGRNPAEVGVETDLPKLQLNGGTHAQ